MVDYSQGKGVIAPTGGIRDVGNMDPSQPKKNKQLFTKKLGMMLFLAGFLILGLSLWQPGVTPGEHEAGPRGQEPFPWVTHVRVYGSGIVERHALGHDSKEKEGTEVLGSGYTLQDFEPMTLTIPAIAFQMEVIDGGVFDEALLRKAPVFFEMSDLPSTRGGNTAFAAHRRGQYAYFKELDALQEGDRMYLSTATHTFVYEMAWQRIVDPYDWSVIDSTEVPALTLQTCEPKYTPSTHRLIIRGYLVDFIQGGAEVAKAE